MKRPNIRTVDGAEHNPHLEHRYRRLTNCNPDRCK
jgi:hypothetical protein